MKGAIYGRVSTNGQGQSPEMQLRELREYIERRGWQVAGEYVDVGISGSKEKRPQLDALMAEAHKRRFDAVIVWKFDRFARSVSHLLRALETFQALGIEFVSLTEGVDTSTPAGKMVFTVLGAVAKLRKIPKGYAVACHEAAHAVVCVAVGSTFQTVRLRDEERELTALDKALGAVSRVSKGQFVPTTEKIFRDRAIIETQIHLAGIVFEKLRQPWKSYLELCIGGPCAQDFTNADRLCKYWVEQFGSAQHKLASKVYEHLLRMTRNLVREHWEDIIALGHALRKCGELSQVAVEKQIAASRKARPSR